MSVPPAVVAAFGLPAAGTPLTGGEGVSVRHGAAVLKPVDDERATAWCAELLAGVEPAGFRLPRPLRAADGRWVVDGWSATEHVTGETGAAGRWPELLRAGRAFHAVLVDVPRPDLLDHRTDRWARADRVAWGELAIEARPELGEAFARLQRMLGPYEAPAQLIHGDLSGNVLFADDELPAIIDFSPYWRPAAYADAIAIADGLIWYGAGPAELALVEDVQLLVRAVLFRLVALDGMATDEGTACLDELPLFERAIATLERMAG